MSVLSIPEDAGVRLCQVLTNRRESMLNNLRASEKRRLMQFQMDISQLRNWKKDVADEALLEVEALTNLLHAPDDLQVLQPRSLCCHCHCHTVLAPKSLG